MYLVEPVSNHATDIVQNNVCSMKGHNEIQTKTTLLETLLNSVISDRGQLALILHNPRGLVSVSSDSLGEDYTKLEKLVQNRQSL